MKNENRWMSRWIYLRILGFCFAATFISILLQVRGLMGGRGIFPASEILAQSSFWKAPGLFWLDSSDISLILVCLLGIFGAGLVVVNRWNRVGLFLCWISFLSLVSVSPQFTWYKADSLLLESAFLAFFLSPKGGRPGFGENDPPSRWAVLAHLWLLFRLMFETGLTKLLSQDPSWRDLSAMAYFHETMPFPTWVGWFFAKLPFVFQRAETVLTLFVELIAPFLLFFGRRGRFAACLLWCILQAGIALSGNFLAFNYQSIALGLFLMAPLDFGKAARKDAWQAVVLIPHAFIGLALLVGLSFQGVLPRVVESVLEAVAPFRSVNLYTLYPFIETERRVVVLEGSDDDGATWREYGHLWQPQDPLRAPRFLAPLSDRFEREMKKIVEQPGVLPYWRNPFIFRTASRLLEGSPPVLRLFAKNPFPHGPPQRIRAWVYRYQSTDLGVLIRTGQWWTRRRLAAYCPVIARNPENGRIDYVDVVDTP